jgi:hypothetical protein
MNIHVLPTDKPSKLFRFEDTLIKNNLIGLYDFKEKGYEAHHIYITSDEEIKDGEYGLSQLNEIIKFHSGYDYRYYAKIILTTNQDLIKSGVQAIDDEFLEWFIKNPKCEEVKVEVDLSKHNRQFQTKYGWKIIIPQEKAKQETLENELWGNVFAKIKQYGLNYEVLTVLKQNFNISKR